MKNQFDLIPLWAKWVTSSFCVFLLIIHSFFPKVTLDWVSVALLAFALVPWFIHLIKGVELPGGARIDLGSVQQSTTDTPIPPSQEPATPDRDLLSDSPVQKTLKTLWKHQQEYYSADPLKRWTFKVIPPAPGYGDYLASVATLVKAGYVTVSPENDFCMLTNEGISFCKENTNKIMSFPDTYHF